METKTTKRGEEFLSGLANANGVQLSVGDQPPVKRQRRNFAAELSGAPKETFPVDPKAPTFDPVEQEETASGDHKQSPADSVNYKEEFTLKVETEIQ